MGESPEDKRFNGCSPSHYCPVANEWGATKEKVEQHMEGIKGALDGIAGELKTFNEQLLGAATGRKQIPLEVVLALILLWGVYVVIFMVRDSHKDIRLNWTDGLVISESGDKK